MNAKDVYNIAIHLSDNELVKLNGLLENYLKKQNE